MRNTITLMALLVIASITACEKVELKGNNTSDCKPYVDLYFNNYDSLKNDPINIEAYKINGDCLELTVNYGGCTSGHKIELAYMHPWCGTPPLPPPTFELKHDSNGELCKMLVTETLKFDLTPLRDKSTKKVTFIVNYKVDAENFKSIELEYQY